MFANRFTALVDACVLVGVLKRDLLCTLAEAGFFRIRWSPRILGEVEGAIGAMLTSHGHADALDMAARQRQRLETAFEEASVSGEPSLLRTIADRLPDPNDAHVIASAMHTQAQVIVTDNLRHFPISLLAEIHIDVRSSDAFIADTISLDPGRAVAAIRGMRGRFKAPPVDGDGLLLLMERRGLVLTVDELRPHAQSL